MANTNRNFINNVDLDEQFSFPHLLETMNPESEEEANLIEDSEYFNNDELQATFRTNSQKLSILNLNCQSINAKFDKTIFRVHRQQFKSSKHHYTTRIMG